MKNKKIMKTLKRDLLNVEVYDSRSEMGAAAAQTVAKYVRKLHKGKREINIVFAAAPSQNEFLASLAASDLPWDSINALHMDEYIGIAKEAPQRFGNFLKERIFDKVPLKSVHYLYEENASPEKVCMDYTQLLETYPPDIIFMGVGENGHIAFNDPHVAHFDDPLDVKIVSLDQACRNQQVNDGCFVTIDEVPTHAITLTIPAMLRAERIFVIVPAPAKANAIKAMADGEITTECPASILRRHANTTLYCDTDSAKYII